MDFGGESRDLGCSLKGDFRGRNGRCELNDSSRVMADASRSVFDETNVQCHSVIHRGPAKRLFLGCSGANLYGRFNKCQRQD